MSLAIGSLTNNIGFLCFGVKLIKTLIVESGCEGEEVVRVGRGIADN